MTNEIRSKILGAIGTIKYFIQEDDMSLCLDSKVALEGYLEGLEDGWNQRLKLELKLVAIEKICFVEVWDKESNKLLEVIR